MFKLKAFSILFGALALATCSVLATAPAWAAADFPTGVFSAKGLTTTITFGDKGQVQVNKGGVLEVEGAYTINGDQIQVTDKSGPWACTKAGQETGAYHWKYDKGVLAFTKVADACKARSAGLAKYEWKKK
jgi:hypothetical protein